MSRRGCHAHVNEGRGKGFCSIVKAFNWIFGRYVKIQREVLEGRV